MRDLYNLCLQIRRAYRNSLTKTHPDKGGDSEKFDRIKTAYEVLADTEKVLLDQGVNSAPHPFVLNSIHRSAERNL